MLLLLLLYPVNAYNNLIIDNYKLVYYIINRKFHYLPIDVKEEVTQDAFIGFIKCAKKYDPNKNYKFTTYAGYYITGYAINSIKRIQRYNNKVIDLTNENYLSFITYDNKNFYDELDNKNIINKFYTFGNLKRRL
jgi:RNA polymerase sigma factor (sigma-70 family)